MTRALLIAIALALLSGLAWGLNQTLLHHFSAFAAMFPDAPEWWNPATSWRLKYAGGDVANGAAFWGSTTVFAWATDAYHATSTLHVWALASAGMLAGLAYRDFILWVWKVWPFNFTLPYWVFPASLLVALMAVRAIGFHLLYTILF